MISSGTSKPRTSVSQAMFANATNARNIGSAGLTSKFGYVSRNFSTASSTSASGVVRIGDSTTSGTFDSDLHRLLGSFENIVDDLHAGAGLPLFDRLDEDVLRDAFHAE